jgi:nucleotide-binding universal stress UspA family protein
MIAAFIGIVLALFIAVSIRGIKAQPRPQEPAGARMEHTASPTRTPRLLVALDGSASSFETVAEVCARPWPGGSEIEVVTVVHSAVPFLPDPAFSLAAAHVEEEERQTNEAPALLEAAVTRLRAASPGVTVSSKVLVGDPGKAILAEAERMQADEIFVGCHGHGAMRRGVMGSVSQHVASNATCSVHIVRPPRHLGGTAAAA